ncbi:MAG TPA: CARDB domain-containing protein, partial [Candidatus Dojkabacteria bacterium]|nr:CARDB domain-containing protein [Candidatus Dojkabacteria bacterium]
MAVRLTKASKIVFAIAIIVLSVVLGFLLWRVNQEEDFGPEPGEAGQSYNGACWDCCKPDEFKYDSNGKKYCPGGSLCGCKVTCGDGVTINKRCSMSDKDACNRCYHAEPGKTDPVGGVECNTGSQCKNKCYWPEVSYCTGEGKCICKSGSSNRCEDTNPKCTPTCPAGYEECSGSNCTGETTNAECSARCAGCDNLYYVKITCRKIPTNVCDGGSWVTRPTGNIAYENNITFSAKAKDSDGIDKASISVKRGTTNIPICTTGQTVGCITLAETATETTISGTLSNASNRLQPGNYEITMSWKDKKGAASAACALSTTFTVLPQQTNPNWSITKGVVEQCIDAGTTNPKSELTYTITVKNTGNGAGTITKIEDVMDSKVQDSFVQTSSITSPGIYANKKITWTFSPALSIAAGATKTYTYKVVIDKDNFDTYANTVTLTPVGSSSIVATANITADCEIGEEPEQPGEEPEQQGEVPQTGIFDTTISRIIAG